MVVWPPESFHSTCDRHPGTSFFFYRPVSPSLALLPHALGHMQTAAQKSSSEKTGQKMKNCEKTDGKRGMCKIREGKKRDGIKGRFPYELVKKERQSTLANSPKPRAPILLLPLAVRRQRRGVFGGCDGDADVSTRNSQYDKRQSVRDGRNCQRTRRREKS